MIDLLFLIAIVNYHQNLQRVNLVSQLARLELTLLIVMIKLVLLILGIREIGLDVQHHILGLHGEVVRFLVELDTKIEVVQTDIDGTLERFIVDQALEAR